MNEHTLDPLESALLIPSLEPDERLPAYAQALLDAGFRHIVVVDDGSAGETYRRIFDRIAALPGCTVLHHEVNRGKGVALKTGYRWLMENLPGIPGVITADADGQHTVADCLRLAHCLTEEKRALYLGSRDFDLPGVPPKSRSGNKLTSRVFQWLYGQYLPDTQTGLRAFRSEDLPFMAEVEGERYEYEMKVLIACARAKIPMIPVTIETIYENNNEGTHFHPLRDSWRIYRVLLGSFIRFMGTSLVCVLIDQVAAWLLWRLLGAGSLPRNTVTAIGSYGARLISASCNYVLNRHVVFKSSSSLGRSVLRYILLCLAVITLSNLGVTLLHNAGMNRTVAKIICDTILYFVNYRIQDRWIFADKGEKHV